MILITVISALSNTRPDLEKLLGYSLHFLPLLVTGQWQTSVQKLRKIH